LSDLESQPVLFIPDVHLNNLQRAGQVWSMQVLKWHQRCFSTEFWGIDVEYLEVIIKDHSDLWDILKALLLCL